MRKTFGLLFLVLLLAAMFVACGQQVDDAEPDAGAVGEAAEMADSTRMDADTSIIDSVAGEVEEAAGEVIDDAAEAVEGAVEEVTGG